MCSKWFKRFLSIVVCFALIIPVPFSKSELTHLKTSASYLAPPTGIPRIALETTLSPEGVAASLPEDLPQELELPLTNVNGKKHSVKNRILVFEYPDADSYPKEVEETVQEELSQLFVEPSWYEQLRRGQETALVITQTTMVHYSPATGEPDALTNFLLVDEKGKDPYVSFDPTAGRMKSVYLKTLERELRFILVKKAFSGDYETSEDLKGYMHDIKEIILQERFLTRTESGEPRELDPKQRERIDQFVEDSVEALPKLKERLFLAEKEDQESVTQFNFLSTTNSGPHSAEELIQGNLENQVHSLSKDYKIVFHSSGRSVLYYQGIPFSRVEETEAGIQTSPIKNIEPNLEDSELKPAIEQYVVHLYNALSLIHQFTGRHPQVNDSLIAKINKERGLIHWGGVAQLLNEIYRLNMDPEVAESFLGEIIKANNEGLSAEEIRKTIVAFEGMSNRTKNAILQSYFQGETIQWDGLLSFLNRVATFNRIETPVKEALIRKIEVARQKRASSETILNLIAEIADNLKTEETDELIARMKSLVETGAGYSDLLEIGRFIHNLRGTIPPFEEEARIPQEIYNREKVNVKRAAIVLDPKKEKDPTLTALLGQLSDTSNVSPAVIFGNLPLGQWRMLKSSLYGDLYPSMKFKTIFQDSFKDGNETITYGLLSFNGTPVWVFKELKDLKRLQRYRREKGFPEVNLGIDIIYSYYDAPERDGYDQESETWLDEFRRRYGRVEGGAEVVVFNSASPVEKAKPKVPLLALDVNETAWLGSATQMRANTKKTSSSLVRIPALILKAIKIGLNTRNGNRNEGQASDEEPHNTWVNLRDISLSVSTQVLAGTLNDRGGASDGAWEQGPFYR